MQIGQKRSINSTYPVDKRKGTVRFSQAYRTVDKPDAGDGSPQRVAQALRYGGSFMLQTADFHRFSFHPAFAGDSAPNLHKTAASPIIADQT